MNFPSLRNIFFLILISTLFSAEKISAQQNDSAVIKVSGYVDAYYAYYTDSVGLGNYQKFPSISPRSGQFGLNTVMLTFQYDAEKIHAKTSLHYGDIARSAWSPTFNNIMEAYVGVRLCKTLWLDGGFFRTHFGTEGLLPRENFTSSVSVNTIYEPYFESGFRLVYSPCDKFTASVYVLNGYNMFEDNNRKKSFGMLLTYNLSDKGNIGYSNYIGDDSPEGDTITHLRMHNNLFFNYGFSKIKIQVGGDFCYQQHSDITTPSKAATMYSGVAALKYQCCPKFAAYTRGEIFNDPQGFMSGVFADKTGMLTGFRMWGATLGIEYKPTDNSYIRLEGRQIEMDKNQQIFRWNNANVSNRMEMLLNAGISF